VEGARLKLLTSQLWITMIVALAYYFLQESTVWSDHTLLDFTAQRPDYVQFLTVMNRTPLINVVRDFSRIHITIDDDTGFSQAVPVAAKLNDFQSHRAEDYMFKSEIASDTRLNRL
jgi:hypothetical protein